MGRKRKDDSLGLPERVYVRCGTFYYVHRNTGVWENLGKDLSSARKIADHHNDPTGEYGTMRWWYDQFLIDCAQRVAAKTLSKRTFEDYTVAAKPLMAYMGHMLPSIIGPHDITSYLEVGAKEGRPVPANRERAALSSCMSWMLRNNHGGFKVNPCMRASGVKRNTETKRERYVTHDEYKAVYAVAGRSVRLMMELVYRTLQRPEIDVLAWTPANVQKKAGQDVLRFRQSKTKRQIDIALTGDLGELVKQAIGEVPQLHQPIVHTMLGEAYTYDGISTMLKKCQKKAGVASFGFRDLKGKGATDMYFLDKKPIEEIQMLCGHASKNTTEIYIKARWNETAQPNAIHLG